MGIFGLVIMIGLLIHAKKKEREEFKKIMQERDEQEQRGGKQRKLGLYIVKLISDMVDLEIILSLQNIYKTKVVLDKNTTALSVEQEYEVEQMTTRRIPRLIDSYLMLNDENKQIEKSKLLETLDYMHWQLKQIEKEIEIQKLQEFNKLVCIETNKSVR